MDSKRYSVWGDLVMVAMIFFASVAACVVPLALAGKLGWSVDLGGEEDRSGLGALVLYAVQFALAIGGACVYYVRRGGRPLFRFKFNWFDAPLTLLGIVLLVAASVVIEPLLNLFPEYYFYRMDQLIGSGGAVVVMLVVVAPLCEELFFRGLVLEQIARKLSAWKAVVVSALFFGIVHLPILPQMVNAFALGIVMGYIYILTRSLVPVMIIHAVNNAIAYIQMQVTGSAGDTVREMIGNDNVYWIVFAVSTAILAVSLASMARAAQNTYKQNAYNKNVESALNENNDE